MVAGYLRLSSGESLTGQLIGEITQTTGELVLCPQLSSYGQLLSDPSYAGKWLVFSHPPSSPEDLGEIVYPAGVICGPISGLRNLSNRLQQAHKMGIVGVDTSIITELMGCYSKLSCFISPKQKGDRHSGYSRKVVVLDFGYGKLLSQILHEQDYEVSLVSPNVGLEQIQLLNPDGVVFSDGWIDANSFAPNFPELAKMSTEYPTFGIGLGHQVLALAHGGTLLPLISNHQGDYHPVREVTTDKILLTKQNHFCAVSAPPDFKVSYSNVLDGSIEGLSHDTLAIRTIQFALETNTSDILADFWQQPAYLGNLGEFRTININ